METISQSPTIKPALVSIKAAADYLSISRAKLYEILEQLETVRLGGRHLVKVESLDRLIAANSTKAA